MNHSQNNTVSKMMARLLSRWFVTRAEYDRVCLNLRKLADAGVDLLKQRNDRIREARAWVDQIKRNEPLSES